MECRGLLAKILNLHTKIHQFHLQEFYHKIHSTQKSAPQNSYQAEKEHFLHEQHR